MSSFSTPFLVLIGLGLFLYGMDRLEAGIRALGYNTFKRWISKSTASPVHSAGLGITITALLQSSSLVSLLVLAFASAGVLPLYNALGVILGANLGTTVTGWMVASIGFKLPLSALALPLMACGAILQLLPNRLQWALGTGHAVFGFGLILFGLDVMKEAVAQLPASWDMSVLKGHGAWVYFLAGAVIAAIIQSSSAAMMLTLTALNGGLLDLSSAAALVIGADLGTTSTTALGSVGGHAIKRQLALGHFLFNLLVDCAALLVLLPVLPLLLQSIGLDDPLYGLVAFHSLFNLLGLLVFLPLLKPYAAWLGGRFQQSQLEERVLVEQMIDVPDAALVASAASLEDMRMDTVVLALHEFHLRPEQLQLPAEIAARLSARYQRRVSVPDRYASLKAREADLLAFLLDLQKSELSLEQAGQLDRQIREARALVYSSKTQMDIRENVAALRHTGSPELTKLYHFHQAYARRAYRGFLELSEQELPESVVKERLDRLLRENDEHFQQSNEAVREVASEREVTGVELSSALNVNRDIHHSIKDLLHGRE